MKKFLVPFAALTMTIGLAACSSSDEAKTTEKEKKNTEEAVAPKTEVKKELVKFYTELGKKINAKDVALDTYVAKASKEDAKPEDLPTVEDKADASAAAAALAAELNSIQIPAKLEDHQAELEAVLKEFAASYQAKADELEKEAPNFEAADTTFEKADEALGKVFESEKLLPPSLGNQVN